MQTVQDRLADLQRQSRIQAGSLMATVLGDAVLPRGGRIWLGSLIGLLERLGVNERLVRTTVFRLAKDDWLLAETEGRRSNYVLSPIGRRRFDEAASHIYAAHAPPWDRRWRLVNVVGDLPARDRERLRRALVWQGFGELSAHTFIHPMADLQTCFEALKAEGLASLMHHLMPLLAANPCLDTSATDADLVRHAWDLQALTEGYDGFIHSYQPMLEELEQAGIPSVIFGKAIYEGKIQLKDFLRFV